MRRSAAPSKRPFGGVLPTATGAGFVSPVQKVLPIPGLGSLDSPRQEIRCTSVAETPASGTLPLGSSSVDISPRPISSFMKLPDISPRTITSSLKPPTKIFSTPSNQQLRRPMTELNSSQTSASVPDAVSRYFTCIWCKKSGRKHKKWEGDAFIKVGSKSVVLLDQDGKEIGRGTGYKVTELAELDDGGRLGVGGKEIEVTGVMAGGAVEWEKLLSQGRSQKSEVLRSNLEPPGARDRSDDNVSQGNVATVSPSTVRPKFTPFKVPSRMNGSKVEQFVPERTVQPGKPMFDPAMVGALVLPRPPPGHALNDASRLVDVVVDPFVSRHLRPHQRAGIIFLYSNLMGFNKAWNGSEEITLTGAILGDEMGLGKTLQSVALVWTFLKQSPLAGCRLAKRVLIVAPSSLLRNWEAEFRKWLGAERITIHIADTGDKVAQFRSYNSAPVLLISYEMLVRTMSEVGMIAWDMVICDEAHRLKNNQIKASACLAELPCKRRLLLTGTPIQNDLGEFFSLVETVSPGLLGSRQQFSRQVEQVVERGRQPGAGEDEREEGREAVERLEVITKQVILRRTQEVINKFLPPKTVDVVFCRPSAYQARLYSHEVGRLLGQVESEPGLHLAAISSLKKICNAPSLHSEVPGPGQGGPPTWEEQSGKLATLTCMLLQLLQTGQEKMVLVSLSTSTLDLLSTLCDKYNVPHCRLDGNTPTQDRQRLVNRFNQPQGDLRVFLLSSKAGGTGLNLIGASRLVMYDIDWNPATDSQAMARVWRDGQTRHCHIYRLVTAGTIEEKIFQRQVMKSGLACVGEVSTCAFTRDELRDLFTFRQDTECDTHDLLQCQCGGSGVVESQKAGEEEKPRACQLGVQPTTVSSKPKEGKMDELLTWRHITSPMEDRVGDLFLEGASDFISYLFSHTIDGNC